MHFLVGLLLGLIGLVLLFCAPQFLLAVLAVIVSVIGVNYVVAKTWR